VKATVLVTDGEQRAALAAVRSLGQAGYRVLVASTTGKSLAGASRCAAADLAAGDPLAAPALFADSVAAAVRAEQVAVVLPITDAALLALLPRREALRPAVIPFPALERVREVADKRAVVEAAARGGIAIPAQTVLESPSDASALQTEPPPFPLVVKPSRSVADRADAGREKLSVRHARDAAELEQVLRALPRHAYPVLLQQRVVGPGVGIFLLLWDGRLIATFAHLRIREKPPAGGVSVYRESIAADPDLVSRSRALLDHFGWSGVAMIEYKLDAATGVPYLMEINGRFWGSLQLAIDAGVDFPALLVALALGEQPASVSSYRVGVRSRWWLGDLDQLLVRLRRTPAELALPPGSPSRLAALGEFLTLWRPGDRGEILRFADPAPACRELANWLRRR
jgi:predicted ATP-grasp superfamily ATP-dependent carboligase